MKKLLKLFFLPLLLLIFSFQVHASNAKDYITSRISGDNRYLTASNIASEFMKSEDKGAILALGTNFPDALSGSILSHKYKMPILLSGPTVEASKITLSYIDNNISKNKKIYILGGNAGIKPEVEDKLKSLGYNNIIRLGGTDRYDTNSKIVDEFQVSKGTPVVIANGQNFPDALSISSIASAKGYPILLTNSNIASSVLTKKLTYIKPSHIYVIGGTGSISTNLFNNIKQTSGLLDDKIERIWGSNRYDTSLQIAKYFNLDSKTISFASGKNFPDSLSGSALSAQKNAPLILVDEGFTDLQKNYIDNTKYTKELFYGGSGALSNSIINSLSKSYNPIYVAPNGNDTNDGSIASPLKTISTAVNKLSPGGTIILRNGSYSRVDINKSGTASNYFTIKSYPGESAIFDGSNSKNDIEGDSAIVFTANGYWNISNISIKNYHGTGIYLKNGAHDIHINNIKISDIDPSKDTTYGSSGIFSEGNVQNCSITNSDIHNVGLKYDRPWHHGIYITKGAQNWTISGNTIHDNSGSALHLYNGSSFSGRNFIIENNKFYNNHKNGLTIWTNASNNIVKNNIFYNNSAYDMEIDPTCTGNTFTYNTFGSYSSDHNIYFIDPGFTNKNTLDYNKYYKTDSKVVYANKLSLDFNRWKSYSQEAHGQFFNMKYNSKN